MGKGLLLIPVVASLTTGDTNIPSFSKFAKKVLKSRSGVSRISVLYAFGKTDDRNGSLYETFIRIAIIFHKKKT